MPNAREKPWYLSRTILGAVITIVAGALKHFGIIDLADAQMQSILDAALYAMELAGGGLAINGRLRATARIAPASGPGNPGNPAVVGALLLSILLATAGPIACASIEAQSPAQRVYAIESDLLIPLAAAKAYVERADADPATKATIKRLVAGVDRTVMTAQAAVRAGDDPIIPTAISAAQAAVGELLAILKNKGIL